VAGRYRFKFSIGLFGRPAETLPPAFTLNGAPLASTMKAASAENSWNFTLDIAPGVLEEANCLEVATGESTDGSDAGYYIDYLRLDVVDVEKKGLMIVLR
jgi:hypothetical protein